MYNKSRLLNPIQSLGIKAAASIIMFHSGQASAGFDYSIRSQLLGESYRFEMPNADKSGSILSADVNLSYSFSSIKFSFRAMGESKSGVQDKARLGYGEVQEFYIDQTIGKVQSLIGINVLNWGVTDFFNPLDLVNTRRFENLLSPIKRGVPMLRIEVPIKNWNLEMVYIPKQQEPIGPSESSRWLPRNGFANEVLAEIPYQNKNIKGVITDQPLDFKISDSIKYDDCFNQNFALRLYGPIHTADVQIVAHQGANQFPYFRTLVPSDLGNPTTVYPEIIYTLGPQIHIQPYYGKLQTFGLGVAQSFDKFLGGFIFKAAGSKSKSLSNQIELKESQQIVTGIEKSFSIFEKNLILIFQNVQIGETYEKSNSAFNYNKIPSMAEIFKQGWLIGLRLSSGLSWSVSIGAALSPSNKGGIGFLEAEKRLTEKVKTTMKAELIDGETNSSLYSIKSASSVKAGLDVSF